MLLEETNLKLLGNKHGETKTPELQTILFNIKQINIKMEGKN